VPRRNDIKKVMIIGSGPIVIGQACENSTTPELRLAKRFEVWAMKLYL
jgi:hypothetical protein